MPWRRGPARGSVRLRGPRGRAAGVRGFGAGPARRAGEGGAAGHGRWSLAPCQFREPQSIDQDFAFGHIINI